MKTFAKIAGGIGLLLVLTSPVSAFVVGPLAFGVKLAAGLALLGFWAVSNASELSSWARSVFYYSSSVVMGLVVIVALAATNYIAAHRSPTWDLTDKKLNSLSPKTLSVLHELKTPVKALVFIPGAVPDAIEQLFRRYARESERFTWEVKDPRRTPDLAKQYDLKEQPLAVVLVRGEGAEATHTRANIEALASAQDGEQELTSSLARLQQVGEQRVYFTTGHGEVPLEETERGANARSIRLLKKTLAEEGYTSLPLNLTEKPEVPRDAAVVVVIGAKNPFTDAERATLEMYLEQGGRLVMFGETAQEPNLDPLLAKYGLQLDPGLVADRSANASQPYVLVGGSLSDHPIVAPLKQKNAENTVFVGARAITVLREGAAPGVTTKPLVLTGPQAWEESAPSEDPTLDPGEKTGQLVLAAASERPIAEGPGRRFEAARVVLFGDSDPVMGAFAFDRDLVLNTLAWASSQPRRITIQPPRRDVSSLDVTPQMMTNIRLVTMELFPMLLIGLGLSIWLTRRAR